MVKISEMIISVQGMIGKLHISISVSQPQLAGSCDAVTFDEYIGGESRKNGTQKVNRDRSKKTR